MSHITQIPFHRQTLVAVEHDGQPYVAMRPIVENLGLDWKSQYVKLTEKFGKGVVIITTPSAGGSQETLCLPLTKLAGFLYSINPSKVKPELRELVIAYQDECDEVLFRHFFGRLTGEHHALIDALFDRHPQWRETVDYLRQGKSSRDIATLQNKHVRNVQRMRSRIAAAGIDVNPAQAA
jgi:hypothetical protein